MAGGDMAFEMAPMMDAAPNAGAGPKNGPVPSPATGNGGSASGPSGSGRD